MKINKIYLPVLFFSCVALGIVIGGWINYPVAQPSFSKNNYKSKLNSLINFIDNEYVDDVQTDSIVDLTVTNILSNLDPHSVYIPKSEQKQEAENMRGDFVGIGINFYMYKDSVAVVKPIANGPAEKAGIKSGDRLLYADNYKLFGIKIHNDTLFKKLRGEEGSKVTLTVYRKSETRKFKVQLERGVVPIKSVDTYVMLNKNVGYIKINRFAETTGNEFHNPEGGGVLWELREPVPVLQPPALRARQVGAPRGAARAVLSVGGRTEGRRQAAAVARLRRRHPRLGQAGPAGAGLRVQRADHQGCHRSHDRLHRRSALRMRLTR